VLSAQVAQVVLQVQMLIQIPLAHLADFHRLQQLLHLVALVELQFP
jgi:hypothetical protein